MISNHYSIISIIHRYPYTLLISFLDIITKSKAKAALAAGIFHREEVPIEAVKRHMKEKGIETR